MIACIMYHGIVHSNPTGQLTATEFEAQIIFLKKFCRFVSAEEFVRSRSGSLLTFDDGYKNNLRIVAPILQKHQVPAIFFVSPRHADQNKYLWFSYLNAITKFYRAEELRIAGRRYAMTGSERPHSLASLQELLIGAGKDPSELATVMDSGPALEDFVTEPDLDEHYRGLTIAEIRELASSKLFEIGSHTVDHPFLSRCSDADIEDQMVRARHILEEATGQPVRHFAYPSGDYDRRGLECARRVYDSAFSVIASLEGDRQYEIQRFGIYNPGRFSLFIKMALGPTLRRLGRPIG